MAISAPTVSIIIPHLNQPDGLDACLASLDAQTLDRSLFEVIVVDNGSDFIPEDIIARHPGTRLLREAQPGPGPARNLGSENAKGEILGFIDADCRADPEWLRRAVRTLQTSPEMTILGGDVRIWRNKDETISAIGAYESVFAYRFKMYIEQQGFSGTGNLVVRRSDFLRIGRFAGINIAEDMEWGKRACEAGFKFRYVPDMIVFHPARRSFHELFQKWDRQIQHYINMERRKPAWRIRWIARALAVLGSPLVDFVTVLGSDRIEGISARAKAIWVLFVIRTHRTRRMISFMASDSSVVWNRSAEI
jgi:glycosyltransferase involved in cell wall biosynthesis